ncbi:hypothetical protein GO003_012110 [Methylicorpusculum oleiharenae]|uniref:hypothetical protein n=1 Tax=Methylicorpusculum oleiharenae TaxID=1338687 RepID=UPI001358783F|nr:hypothetical protein [Methylicorpusculum oleiharenae]MCD2451137.1 hypothetical protein [Methylicorpusculum oleiharenae]
MEVNIQLEDLIREVQRKLGRNVILFQQIEHMLKYMLIHQDIKFFRAQGEMKSNLQERKNTFVNQTLGNVAKHFVENSFTTYEQGDDNSVSDEASKCVMSFTRGPMLCDEDFYNQRKYALTALIAERNELIHHFLPKWNFGNYESAKAAEQYLDQQRERVFPEFELIKSITESFQEAGKQLSEYLTTDEGWKELELSPLRDSRHIAWLVVFAIKRKRDNGWAVLDAARVFVHQNVDESWLADELIWIKKRHGCKTLREIAEKSEYFEILEEATNKGGVRILYRVKPGLEFDIQ